MTQAARAAISRVKIEPRRRILILFLILGGGVGVWVCGDAGEGEDIYISIALFLGYLYGQ